MLNLNKYSYFSETKEHNGNELIFHNLRERKQIYFKWMNICNLQSILSSLIIYISLHTCHFSSVSLSVTLWTIACQAIMSMGFSRQKYWNRLPCIPPGDLLYPGIKHTSFISPAFIRGFITISTTWETLAHL